MSKKKELSLLRRILMSLRLIEQPMTSATQAAGTSAATHSTSGATSRRSDTAQYLAIEKARSREQKMSEARQNRSRFDALMDEDVKEQVSLMQTIGDVGVCGSLKGNGIVNRTFHVLYLDADESLVDDLRCIFEAYKQPKYIFHSAKSPEDGMHKLTLYPIDAIILDLDFGIVRVNVREFLKRMGGALRAPILIYSACVSPRDKSQYLDLGVNNVLIKGEVEPRELPKIVYETIYKKASGLREAVE